MFLELLAEDVFWEMFLFSCKAGIWNDLSIGVTVGVHSDFFLCPLRQ